MKKSSGWMRKEFKMKMEQIQLGFLVVNFINVKNVILIFYVLLRNIWLILTVACLRICFNANVKLSSVGSRRWEVVKNISRTIWRFFMCKTFEIVEIKISHHNKMSARISLGFKMPLGFHSYSDIARTFLYSGNQKYFLYHFFPFISCREVAIRLSLSGVWKTLENYTLKIDFFKCLLRR